MPTTKQIDAMTAATALGGTEEIPGVQSAANVKITATQIKTFTSASPTLVTPVLGVATGTSLALGGAAIGSNALAVTGTANIGGALITTGFVYISGGADNRLLFGSSVDTSLSKVSAGVVGFGTGTQGSVAGGLQAATVALGGATIGSNALAVTGTASFSGVVASGISTTAAGPLIASGQNGGYYAGVYASQYAIELGISTTLGGAPASAFGTLYYDASSKHLTLGQGSAAATSFGVGGANTFQHGASDAASPIAQTIKFQDVATGTSNTAGVNATIQAPAGTGTGAGGSLIFQVAAAGSSGTAKNAWATALTIASDKSATFTGNIWLEATNWIVYFGRGGITFAGDGVFEIFSTGYASNVRITAGASNLATFNGGITAGSILTTTASTTARASLNIPSGVAPTTPTNGDIWSDGSDLKVRLGGVTYTLTKV